MRTDGFSFAARPFFKGGLSGCLAGELSKRMTELNEFQAWPASTHHCVTNAAGGGRGGGGGMKEGREEGRKCKEARVLPKVGPAEEEVCTNSCCLPSCFVSVLPQPHPRLPPSLHVYLPPRCSALQMIAVHFVNEVNLFSQYVNDNQQPLTSISDCSTASTEIVSDEDPSIELPSRSIYLPLFPRSHCVAIYRRKYANEVGASYGRARERTVRAHKHFSMRSPEMSAERGGRGERSGDNRKFPSSR